MCEDIENYYGHGGWHILVPENSDENDFFAKKGDELEGVEWWLGITDEAEEGKWVNMYTGNDLIIKIK